MKNRKTIPGSKSPREERGKFVMSYKYDYEQTLTCRDIDLGEMRVGDEIILTGRVIKVVEEIDEGSEVTYDYVVVRRKERKE